jgi:hypothetical protein
MSKLWTLISMDYAKGLIVAVITAVLTILLQMLQNQQTIDFKQIGLIGLTAGIAYILKNLATDSQGVPLGTADKK